MTYTETEPDFDDLMVDTPVVLSSELHKSGVQIDRVSVSDGYENYPGREQVQAVVDNIDQYLIEHPEWPAPMFDKKAGVVIRNPASDLLYETSETLQEWFLDAAAAKAAALYPLQHPEIDRLPSGGYIDDDARAFFYHGLDAIGIRTRANIMKDVVERRFDGRPSARWISLACGGAVPVIDALKHCGKVESMHLDFVDIDSQALDFASHLATHEVGLRAVKNAREGEGLRSYTSHQINLLRGLIATDAMVSHKDFGEGSADMVDALGIFEYFSEKNSVAFLRNAYRLVREDGVIVFANMLSDRPQMDFNERGVGWPKLYPRSIDELAGIINEAGIEPERARIIVPEDGIYAVIEIQK